MGIPSQLAGWTTSWSAMPDITSRLRTAPEGRVRNERELEAACTTGALPHHLERLRPASSVSVDSEVVVEGGHSLKAEALHCREARPVNEGGILVREVAPGGPRGLKVGRAHGFQRRDAGAKRLPKRLRCLASDSPPEQRPCLHQDMVGSDQGIAGGEDLLGAHVAGVSGVRGCVPGRRIDEEAHRRSAVCASPSIESLWRAMSEPADVPRSKTADGLVDRLRLPRSS